MPKIKKHIYPMSFFPPPVNITGMEFDENYWRYVTQEAAPLIEPNRYMVGYFGELYDTFLDKPVDVYQDRGYYKALLFTSGTRKSHYSIHRINNVTWNGPPPNEFEKYTDHVDCDKHNNYPWNLEWVTNGENCRRATFNDRYCMKPIFDIEEVHNICRMLKQGMHPVEISNAINYKYGNRDLSAHIHQIRNNETWKYIVKDYLPFPEIQKYQRAFTREIVEDICQMLQDNELSMPQIARIIESKYDTGFDFEKIKRTVGNIKSRHNYTDISSKYTFTYPKSKNKER